MPDTFQVNFTAYMWNQTTQALHFLNATGYEFVDTGRNQERINQKLYVEGAGYGWIYTQMDFNQSLITQYLKNIDLCQKFRLPFNVSLPDIFAKLKDPTLNVTECLGLREIPWTGLEGYLLRIYPVLPGLET